MFSGWAFSLFDLLLFLELLLFLDLLVGLLPLRDLEFFYLLPPAVVVTEVGLLTVGLLSMFLNVFKLEISLKPF